AVGNGREATTEELVRNADVAMYEAKRRGKARYIVFNEALSHNGRGAVQAAPEAAKSAEHAEALESEPPAPAEAAPPEEAAAPEAETPLEPAAPPEPALEIAEARTVEVVEEAAGADPPAADTAPSGPDEREP